MNSQLRSMWHLNKYTWMSLGFAFIYLILIQAQGLLEAPVWVAWVLFGLGAIDTTARTLLAYRLGGSLSAKWSTFFNGMEIVLVTAAIGITGSVHSDLWLLYFVILIFESLYTAPRDKRLLDLYIFLMYLAATLPHQILAKHTETLPIYLRLFFTHEFFLVLVSALARRISQNARARDYELMLLREQMAANEERSRIAREVHDSLGHTLVSVILRLELCVRLMRKDPEEAETILKDEVVAIRSAWNEGRDLAFHLRPWETEQIPMPEALRRHIARFAERTGLMATLAVEEGSWDLRPDVAFGLTRLVQEALTNVARHSAATHAEVRLSHGPGRVICSITDDGHGFDVGASGGGTGLQSMRERAERLGGDLHIESETDKGAKVTVSLPG